MPSPRENQENLRKFRGPRMGVFYERKASATQTSPSKTRKEKSERVEELRKIQTQKIVQMSTTLKGTDIKMVEANLKNNKETFKNLEKEKNQKLGRLAAKAALAAREKRILERDSNSDDPEMVFTWFIQRSTGKGME